MLQRRHFFLSSVGLGSFRFSPAQTLPVKNAVPAGDIFEAAFKGDVARATALAKLNPAIARLRSAEGRTALHYAVEGGQTAMIFYLTTQGADLSAGPESPLLKAVDYPDRGPALDMSVALLMNGSDANAKRGDGRSALELATARGYSDVVEMLVHRGATGSDVQTERVYFGKRTSFDAKGQPYKAENIDGLPQDFINEFARLSHGDVERVKHLAKIAPGLVGARATWDESGIEAAAHMGLFPLARHLADLGAPVSTCTATVLGLIDRVEALVKSDPACVRERGAHDIALLAYTAFSEQRVEIADVLLRAGANVHAKALGGMTTLHLAAGKGYIELAEVLLSHGADVNAAVKQVTPLSAAVKAKQEKMVEFLKGRGARG
jgi:ankyrin repeat protein